MLAGNAGGKVLGLRRMDWVSITFMRDAGRLRSCDASFPGVSAPGDWQSVPIPPIAAPAVPILAGATSGSAGVAKSRPFSRLSRSCGWDVKDARRMVAAEPVRGCSGGMGARGTE